MAETTKYTLDKSMFIIRGQHGPDLSIVAKTLADSEMRAWELFLEGEVVPPTLMERVFGQTVSSKTRELIDTWKRSGYHCHAITATIHY